MTLQEIIDKWDKERNRLMGDMEFCDKHNFIHERDYLYQRYNAISDVLLDIKYNMEE